MLRWIVSLLTGRPLQDDGLPVEPVPKLPPVEMRARKTVPNRHLLEMDDEEAAKLWKRIR